VFIALLVSTVGMGIACSAAVVHVNLSPGKCNTSLYSSQILMRKTLSSLFKWSVLYSCLNFDNLPSSSTGVVESIRTDLYLLLLLSLHAGSQL
jgi:hypothetical protein